MVLNLTILQCKKNLISAIKAEVAYVFQEGKLTDHVIMPTGYLISSSFTEIHPSTLLNKHSYWHFPLFNVSNYTRLWKYYLYIEKTHHTDTWNMIFLFLCFLLSTELLYLQAQANLRRYAAINKGLQNTIYNVMIKEIFDVLKINKIKVARINI